jgi:dipicolinate synthase subunit A
METTYLLAGGDRRQFWLSRLLVDRGRVFTLGVPGLEDSLPDRPADVLVLPTPCVNAAGLLRGPGDGLDPAALRGLYDDHTCIYGGALPPEIRDRFPGCGPVTELLGDPAVSAANGRLTAEAAAALAAERLEGSLFGRYCLVLGFGRVGKPLAALLKDLHARVTVAARRPGVRAEAAQLGYCVRDFTTAKAFPLGGRCHQASPPSSMTDEGLSCQQQPDIIFNTVPAQALSRRALEALGPDCLWVELASAPGGLPADWRPPFAVLPANSLPGRRLPRSAAAALLEGIVRKEMGQ